MSPFAPSRRRADEFDALLSSVARHGPSGEASPYADLVGLVTSLRDTRAPTPRADFAVDLRMRLMAAAESALAAAPVDQVEVRLAPTTRRTPRERRIVAAVGGFAIVGATASMAVAAQSALPGDTLYPLKRAIENAEAGVQRGDDGRGSILLGNATGRLDEVGALSRDGDDNARAIAATLDDFVAQASEASDLLLRDYSSTGHASSIEELRSFTAESMGALTSLQTLVPRDARAALISATQVITAIDVRAQGLCPTCTDLPVMQDPVFASSTLDALLDDAVGPLAAPVSVGDEQPATGKGTASKHDKEPSRATKGRAPSASRIDRTPGAPGTPPSAQPTLPQAPRAPDGETKGDDTAAKGGLLGGLNVRSSKDPIGDLLTGTGTGTSDDTPVDEVDGIDGAVDGLSDALGSPDKH